MKGCFFNRFAIVAIFALFGISRYATATEISPEEAKIAVANWVARGYSLGKLTGRQISSAELVVDSETGAELRVVKFCGGGFVVTAADDLVDPILAFSENGDGIDLDESNPFWSLLRADIASREESCGVVRSNSKRTLKAATASELVRQSENGGVKTTGRTAAQRKWDDLLERGSVMRLASSSGMSSISDVRVEPFISTKWNQSTAGGKNCWNYYTPNNYPCGCVATAIAQIMRYWKYPTLPVEAKARECYVDDNQVTKSMYGGTYDWSLMQLAPSYSSVPTDAQCQAMGKLTYDVGVSVEMNWGATESGSWLAAGMPALTEDFHFANAIVLMYQSGYYDYSLEEFKKAAIPNLDAHQPLALGIYGSGGHAILVDGYGFSDDSFYIHANMGWSGYCDVWYCPPDIQNYTAIEEVLCNISPTKKGNILSGRVVDDQNVPIAGATVVLLSGETELLTTTTDDKGIYSFVSEKTGAFTISASAGGMSASVSGNLSTTTPLELADHEGSNRSGRYYYTSCAIGNSHGNDIVLGNGTPMFSLVTLEQQDGTGGTSSVKATYGNPMPTISPPEHPTSGYSFAGYWTEPFGSGTQYYFSTGESARNWDRMANTTLYAFWTLDDAPSCDNFADSRTIFGATGSAAFCNVGYTKEQGEPEHSRRENVWGHSSAWASWIPEVSGDYTFYLQGSSTNMVAMPEEIKTMVSVYKGTSVKSLSLVASDDGTPNSSASSRLSFHAEAGVEYKIAMDTYAAIQGILTLRWEEGYVHWIKIEYSSLFAPRSGCSETVSFESSARWEVVDSPNWVLCTFESGIETSGFLRLTVLQNDSGNTRYAEVSLRSADSKPVIFTIRQNTIDFVTTKTDAESAAWRENKRILLVSGRETCWNTIPTLFSTIPDPSVLPLVESNYVVWYNNCDRQTSETSAYYKNIGWFSLPLVSIIDPVDMASFVARTTDYQSVSDMMSFLRQNSTWNGLPPALAFGVSAKGTAAIVSTRVRYWGEGASSATIYFEVSSDAKFDTIVDSSAIGSIENLFEKEQWGVSIPNPESGQYCRIRISSGDWSVFSDTIQFGVKYVSASAGDDANDGNSWASAKASIQAAVDDSAADDLILVNDGRYEPISTKNKSIEIRSIHGASETMIDASLLWPKGITNRCATLNLGWDSSQNATVLSGFTLTNGIAEMGGGSLYGTLNNCTLSGNTASYGGGSHCGTLNNCMLSGNTAKHYGGGSNYGTLNNCTLRGNTAKYDGGGSYYGTLNNCTLSGNTADYGGGSCYGMLNNCTLSGNTADYGGGSCYGMLNNCTLSGNTADYGGGSFYGTLNNCIVWGNEASEGRSNSVYRAECRYSCLDDEIPGGGNLFTDPLFADAANGDYSVMANSPCIDAGANDYAMGNTDIVGNPRIIGGRVDIGAWEFDHNAPHPTVYTVNLDRQNGSGGNDVVRVLFGYSMPRITPPTLDGHIFGGFWSLPCGNGIQYYAPNGIGIKTYDLQNDVTLFAYWIESSLPFNGDLYVDAMTGNDTNDGKSWATAKASIQAAIDISRKGYLILVNDGRYEPIVSRGMDIEIRSVNGAEATIIDASLLWFLGITNRCATFWDTKTVLTGFCLTNGMASSGGGSYYGTLNNCTLSGNTASHGGGSYIGTLNNCTLSGNTASYGGGSYYGTLNNCTLSGNTADYGGGSCYGMQNNCTLSGNTADSGGGSYYGMLNNCTLSGNTADYGGGSYDGTLNNCTLNGNTAKHIGGGSYYGTLSNCLLVDNAAEGGGGSYYGTMNNCTLSGNTASRYGGGTYYGTLKNCIVWGNKASLGDPETTTNSKFAYSCVGTDVAGIGNICADPCFAAPANGNFHLNSNSPCVDAGLGIQFAISMTDLDGNPRWQGDRIDMGAYESAGVIHEQREQEATTWFVDGTAGNDDNDGTKSDASLKTIQRAIEKSIDGDTIIVAPGIYSPIVTFDSHLRIVSSSGNANTVIDGTGTMPCATFGTTTNSTLEGFTLRNGRGEYGGGSSWGTLDQCVLFRNEAKNCGGGSYYGVLNNCILTGNTAGNGGGGSYGGTLNNCTLVGNSTARGGGGSYSVTLNNCTLSGNTANHSAGGSFYGTLNNCTLSGNTAQDGGGSYYGTLNNCIVWDNEASEGGSNAVFRAECRYSCVDEEVIGDGNFFENPLFVDAKNGDFRVMGDSPCIDTGANDLAFGETDVGGNPRISGERVDIGAWEFNPNILIPAGHLIELDMQGGVGGTTVVCALFGHRMPAILPPTLYSHVFNGYWTEPNGRGTCYYTEYGTSVNNCDFSDDTTLYASWTKVLPTDGDLYVDAAKGNDENDGHSWSTAKASIQAAIDISSAGDLILVNDGRYEPIDSEGKRIEIRSVNGFESTIIDAGLLWERGVTNRCATLGEEWWCIHDTILSGFCLTNGVAENGGGSMGGTLNNCTLNGNSAHNGGGGWRSNLNNCIVRGNSAEFGGGCLLNTEEDVLSSCMLVGNTASREGGGTFGGTLNNCTLVGNVAIEEGGGAWNSTLSNCLLHENSSKIGGGSYAGLLSNCTICENIATSFGGGVAEGTLNNCILWQNTATECPDSYQSDAIYSCVPEDMNGVGNISMDPMFIDAAHGDFHLQPTSPCIDVGWRPLSGIHETDLDGNQRRRGVRIDIGAYEADGQAYEPPSRYPIKWYVDDLIGSDTNDGYSDLTPLKSIQSAVERACDGDTIMVASGVYSPIATMDLQISIISRNGKETATIDGGGLMRCATLGETENSRVDGFTLRNGRAYEGGGSRNGTLMNCFLTNNVAIVAGGGSYHGYLTNCVFTANIAEDGAGVGWGYLVDCELIDNSATRYGGGGYCSAFVRCLLKGNSARLGGGAYGENRGVGLSNCILSENSAVAGGGASSTQLRNCTLIGNTASHSGGGADYGTLNNCIVWGNFAMTSNAVYKSACRYSCLDEIVYGEGNVFASPRFVDFKNGDFRLRRGSPCIDSGSDAYTTGTVDISRNMRIMGAHVDMGAYEFDPASAGPDYGDVLDDSLEWTSGGDAEWNAVSDGNAIGGFCAESGAIGDSQTTWIETTVEGPGTIAFRWKVSSQARLDRLTFLADGAVQKFIAGITEWNLASFEIDGDGTHTLKWAYSKSPSGTAGDDRGWLDDVQWTPRVAGAEFGVALESPEMPWTSGGDDADPWIVVETPSFDGVDACAAYAVGSGGLARIATEVEGNGKVSFKWRVEYGTSISGIAFMVDGEDVDYCEASSWSTYEHPLSGAGKHVLAWEFFWDGEPDGDAGYLDNVAWTPDAGTEQTTTTPTPVPFTWLGNEAPSILSAHGGDYEAAANATAANGVNKVWECYVAGIDPEEEAAKFEATIEIVDGKPVVKWNPPLSKEEEAKRVRRVFGKKTLDSKEEWTDVTDEPDLDAAGYRFFKAAVEMK